MGEGHYSLQFSGLDSDSPEKLQRFKSICVADLALSIEDTQGLLSSQETRILRTSSSLPELEAYLQLLLATGARVAILSPDGSDTTFENAPEDLTFDLEEILDLDIPLSFTPAKPVAPRAPKEYHLDLDADLSDSLVTDSSLLFSSPDASSTLAPSQSLAESRPPRSVTPAVLDMSFVDDEQTTVAVILSPGEDTIASLITSVKDQQALRGFDPLDLVLGPTPEELSPRDLTTSLDDALSLDLPIMGAAPIELTAPGIASAAASAGSQRVTAAVVKPPALSSGNPHTTNLTPEASTNFEFSTSDAPTSQQPSAVVAPRPVQPAATPLQFAGLAFDEPTPKIEAPLVQARVAPEKKLPQEPPSPPLSVAAKEAIVVQEHTEATHVSLPLTALPAAPAPAAATTAQAQALRESNPASVAFSSPQEVPAASQPKSTRAISPTSAVESSREVQSDEVNESQERKEDSSEYTPPAEAAPLSRLQLFGIFAGGLTLLLAGNWLLAPTPEETPVPEIGALSANEPVLDSSARIPKAPPSAAVTLKSELKGELRSEQFTLSVNVLRASEAPNAPTITTRFVLTTPKPPELTNEEIAQGTLPRIWLKRVESDAAVLRASGSNDSGSNDSGSKDPGLKEWSGSVPTYVFVERGVERRRLPALTLVSISVSGDGSTGEANIDISYAPPGDTTLPAQGAMIEAAEKDGYRIAATATVKLTTWAPE